jgi:hypothetical protein
MKTSDLHQQLSEILKEEMEKDYDKRLTAEKQRWQSEGMCCKSC